MISGNGAAILIVDRAALAVTFANEPARQLAPELELPVSVDVWSAAAGLSEVTTGDLDPSISSCLTRAARGEILVAETVSAGRETAVDAPRELFVVTSSPITGAPGPLDCAAVVSLVPLSHAQLPGPLDSAAELRERAVLATSVSFTITDPAQPDNPLVWVNPAFTATTGYSREEVLGRNCRFLQGPDSDQRAVAALKRSVTSLLPITTTLLNYRKDGTPFWNELSVSPIVDRSGAVTHFVGVQTDVTVRIEAQRARDAALTRAEVAAGRLALLADFATRLTTSLDADAITHLLADMLVPQLGSWCVLQVADADGDSHVFIEHERLYFDPHVKELVGKLTQAINVGVPPDNPSRRVLRGEVSNVLVSDVVADEARAGLSEDDVSAIARQLGIASLIIVPLAVRDRILGCVTIVADATRPQFEQADLSLAQELTSRAALMLENSRLYTHERSAAVSLQRSLLPLVPALPGFSVAAEYLTATDQAAVGGDWYDVFALRTAGIGVAVGDAMGHNFDSAAAMGKLSTMLRAYAWPGAGAGQVLDSVDQLISGTGANYLATCFYGVLLRTDDGAALEYASAGHPAPILRLPDGSTEILDDGRGAMLGVLPLLKGRARARQGSSRLLPRGSTLVVFTDGLIDSMGEDVDIVTAIERLARMLSTLPAAASPKTVVSALAASAGGGRKDDIAVIAVRVD